MRFSKQLLTLVLIQRKLSFLICVEKTNSDILVFIIHWYCSYKNKIWGLICLRIPKLKSFQTTTISHFSRLFSMHIGHYTLCHQHVRWNPKWLSTKITQRMAIRKRVATKQLYQNSTLTWIIFALICFLILLENFVEKRVSFCLAVFKISNVCRPSAIPSWMWQCDRIKANFCFGISLTWPLAA